MNNFAKFIVTILLLIFTVSSGIFIFRILLYVFESRDLNIPFYDIIIFSIKAGSAGGGVGGIGIYFIPYFFSIKSGR